MTQLKIGQRYRVNHLYYTWVMEVIGIETISFGFAKIIQIIRDDSNGKSFPIGRIYIIDTSLNGTEYLPGQDAVP